MNKFVIVFLMTFIIVNLVAGIVFFTGNQQTNTRPTNQQNSSSGDKISLSQLSSHNRGNDCWVNYNGKVYDVSEWLSKNLDSIASVAPYCGESLNLESISEGIYKGELE